MTWIYLFIIKLAGGLLSLINLFLKRGKLKDFIEGRNTQDLSVPLPKNAQRYWFHCASLGEFEQARPVIEALKSKDPSNSIVVSFFSPSGYQQRKDYSLADAVIYLPLDTPANARKVLNYLNPDYVIFVKYELWYFYLSAIHQRQIPCYLISATFRPNQFIFSFLGSWLYRLLPKFSRIFLQDESSYQLLEQKGLSNIQLSGDTRYDRVKEHALKVKLNAHIEAFKGVAPLIILGSSWQAEEALAEQLLQDEAFKSFKILIVPHDISQKHIDTIYNSVKNYGVSLYTDHLVPEGSRVMVLNTIGHLSSAYYYGDIALIGGAFGKGLHNILEALSFGVPVLFGTNTSKFPEAALAMQSEVAMSISDSESLKKSIHYFLPQQHLGNDLRAKCIDFINWHSGATEKVLKVLEEK
jgi:3-deoxy-D-manno-octulosonic-acid transferase